ncbi:helix-turn-helix domain-containing protein [Empedobacter falsenii]
MVAVDYNNMPEALSFLINQINSLKEQLKESARFNQSIISDEEEILLAEDVAQLLKVTIGTIRTKTSNGEIPSMKRLGKNYYLKSEIIEYLKQGKKLSFQQIQEQANQYLLTKKGSN